MLFRLTEVLFSLPIVMHNLHVDGRPKTGERGGKVGGRAGMEGDGGGNISSSSSQFLPSLQTCSSFSPAILRLAK